MKPATALREALAALVVRQPAAEALDETREQPATFDTLLEAFGSTGGIADAAGFPKAPTGSPDWRARQSLLRRLQRWRDGSRRPASLDSLVQQLREQQPPLRGPPTMRAVLKLIEEDGRTVVGFTAYVIVSKEGKWRTVPDIYIEPDALVEAGFFEPAYAGQWVDAAEAFYNAWAECYGIGRFVVVDEVDELVLKIGEP